MSVFIIAEAGVNHNGLLTNAKKLVNIAKAAGANCVKFQTVIPERCVSKDVKKADYQVKNTGNDESQLDMIKKLVLTFDEFIELKAYCDKQDILFISTPFDLDSIEFLNNLNIKFWKIPSGEITNLPYLIKIAETHKPVILSTGMSTMEEIAETIQILRKYGTKDIKLLHCNTEYPTLFEDVNLKAMLTMKERFGLEVGYSDHTKGIEVSIAAVAMGATVIEKHFTIDKIIEGPDHKASLSPEKLKEMVHLIKNIEKAMGTGEKQPSQSEFKNIDVIRKSIVADKGIKKGEIFTEKNITTKRPGNGISPMKWFEILGQPAKKDFEEDELIKI
ncbi:MAG: N-acetylneuraminate synthase [Streptococcaceae bacterium]|nr:N-acetylneuraminate synthase [Streptococcaceae bacterium]